MLLWYTYLLLKYTCILYMCVYICTYVYFKVYMYTFCIKNMYMLFFITIAVLEVSLSCRKSTYWPALKMNTRIFSHCFILLLICPFFVYVLIPLLTDIIFLSIFHYYQEFYREILNLKHFIFLLMPKWKLIKENTGKQKCEYLKVSTILLWNNYWMISWHVCIQVCSYIYPFLSKYKHICQSANLYICK